MANSEVIAEIGIEITEFRENMSKVVQSIDATTDATTRMDKATKDASKSLVAGSQQSQKESGKLAHRTGQVAMQLQDVAVQAQMGTGALQIFAQQGSQIASVFGGMKGAVVGSVLAIGAALVSAGVESEKTFANMINGANTLENELSGIAGNGSLNAVVKGFEQSASTVEKLTEEVESLGGFWRGLWEDSKAVATLGYTDTQLQKIAATEKEIGDYTANNARLMERFRVVAAESIKIATLRANGETEAADALQRQIELKQELEAIESGKGTAYQKAQLKLLAQGVAAQKEIQIENEKNRKLNEERDDHERKQKEDFYKFQEQEEAKSQKQKEDRHEAEKKHFQEIEDFNNDMRRAADERAQEEVDNQKKLQDAAGEMLDEWRDEEVDARNRRIEKNKANKESLADAIRETQLMQAQAHGTDLQAKLLRNQLEFEEKIAQAKKDGNAELEKQLRIQRGIADMEAKIDDKLKTPQQRREEKLEQRKRDSAERKIRSKEKLNGVPPIMPGVPPAPNNQPNAPNAPAGGGAAAPQHVMRVETIIVETIRPK
jgi:hypothetical protein